MRCSARSAARMIMAGLSALVLVLTGYGWIQVHQLTAGLSRANVIDPAAATARHRDTAQVGAPAAVADAETQTPAVEQNILLVGMDNRTDAQGNPLPAAVLEQLHAGSGTDGGDSTDTMIVLHLPAGAGRATAISIPRDSYVQLADGFGYHKINSAYAYGQHVAKASNPQLRGAELERVAAQAGARTAIATVERLTGLQITHYVAVNLAGFYQLSQAIGGVEVCLNTAAHDDYSGVNLSPGQHNLQGAQALAFVRQRHGLPRGDLDRITRQQAFLASMAHQVLSAGTLTDPAAMTRLTAALHASLTVDAGFNVLAMTRQLQHISAGALHFTTIPTGKPDLLTADGQAVQVDPELVHTFIANLDTNSAPDPVASNGDPDTVHQPGDVTGPTGTDATARSSTPQPITAGGLTCTN